MNKSLTRHEKEQADPSTHSGDIDRDFGFGRLARADRIPLPAESSPADLTGGGERMYSLLWIVLGCFGTAAFAEREKSSC